jgi:hypothetical protein
MDTEVKTEVKTEAQAVETTAPVTIEELQKKLDELTRHASNKEAEALRVHKKVEAFEKAEAERKQAEMTEMDKLSAKLAEAEAKRTEAEKTLQDERVKNEIYAEASKMQFGNKQKFASPEIAFKLLSEEDKASILPALQKLAKDNPFLLENPAAVKSDLGSPRKGVKVDASALEDSVLEKKRREYSGL